MAFVEQVNVQGFSGPDTSAYFNEYSAAFQTYFQLQVF